MKLLDKINELNNYCRKSLSITHYPASGWEISSYKDGTLFCVDGRLYRENYNYHLHDKRLNNLINTAYKEMLKDKQKDQ
jgi:hypothetical protein